MLARSWSGPEVIAIWVELVEDRKMEIGGNCNPTKLHGMAAPTAAKKEIS